MGIIYRMTICGYNCAIKGVTAFHTILSTLTPDTVLSTLTATHHYSSKKSVKVWQVEMNLPTKVNSFLVTVTDSHRRVMTKSAAGPARSPVMNAASGGAAVSKLSCVHRVTMLSFIYK